MKKCCFTGHRTLLNYDELKIKVYNTLVKLVDDGYTDFYAGGAIGWDTLCAQAVIALRDKEHKPIALHLVLPCPKEAQTSKWTTEQIQLYDMILSKADSVEIMSRSYSRECMKVRNQRLIDDTDLCLCYYNDTRYATGTGQTVRMAERKGMDIINLF